MTVDRFAEFDQVHEAPEPTRRQVEDARDAQLWRILLFVSSDTTGDYSGTVPDVLTDARDVATELAASGVGEASTEHVQTTTRFLEAAHELVKIGITVDDVPDFLRAAARLSDDGVGIVKAATALGSVWATGAHTPGGADAALLAVRATIDALR